jgi:hypothetical protein
VALCGPFAALCHEGDELNGGLGNDERATVADPSSVAADKVPAFDGPNLFNLAGFFSPHPPAAPHARGSSSKGPEAPSVSQSALSPAWPARFIHGMSLIL